jgi:DNA-binding transcriptional ArsR family regulator
MVTMPPEVRVEHTYPRALGFARRHGAQSVLVLHDLLAHAHARDGRVVVQASVREIAERLETLSKDTVNRRLRALIAAGVLEVVPRDDADVFEPTTYVVHLDNSGIAVHPTTAA